MIRMIDITDKKRTRRQALARIEVRASARTLRKIRRGGLAKGDVVSAAQSAGILAAKAAPALLPLCHPVRLTHAGISFEFRPKTLVIVANVKAEDATGVEMEALTACAVAALTVYDMAKAEEPGIVITGLRLIKKTGGKSDFTIGKNSAAD
ncbi:MAG: cyclic pyranopterin monophosphate synthase MoaC [Deltaproteobacteria bacterium]